MGSALTHISTMRFTDCDLLWLCEQGKGLCVRASGPTSEGREQVSISVTPRGNPAKWSRNQQEEYTFAFDHVFGYFVIPTFSVFFVKKKEDNNDS